MSLCLRHTLPVMSIALSLGLLVTASPRSSAQTPYFNSTSLGAVKDGLSDNLVTFGPGEADHQEGEYPTNTLIGFTRTFSGPDGATTFNAYAAANYRGFWSTGTYAHGTVTNAYDSGAPGFDPPHGFVVLGGAGSWTKHRFETPEALLSAHATFHWHVTGETSANLGAVNSRLDFAVTQGAAGFVDLYNSAVTPDLLTAFGPGNYSYNTGVALGVGLDFLFWSSAFWDVSPGDIASLGGAHKDLFGNALFNSSFVLDSIDLFDTSGNEITNWQLIDIATGAPVFNQDGRVAAVPEPGPFALPAGASAAVLLFLAARRRRAARNA